MSEPLISVVIPAKNGASKINECLKGILSQNIPVAEIIVIDSGSTDGTQEIIKQLDKTKLIEIPPSEFNHGGTRNLGVDATFGDYVVLTVQDAIPADEFWLERLLKPFEDKNIAAVCGQQIVPHDPDKNPVQWFRPQSEPNVTKHQFQNPSDFDALPANEKVKICGWDDVTACYRRVVLAKLPFQNVTFGEDALWAKDALRRGYSLAYNPSARVYHYHAEPVDFAFKRAFITFYHRYQFFNHVPVTMEPGIKRRLQIIKLLLKENISIKQKWFWWKYNMNGIRARKKALNIFKNAIQQGQKEVERMYAQYCAIAPIAPKTSNFEVHTKNLEGSKAKP